MTIAPARRATARQVVADSNDYDASTMQVSRDGMVTALKAANKTSAGHDPARYNVGHIDDMVGADGTPLGGF